MKIHAIATATIGAATHFGRNGYRNVRPGSGLAMPCEVRGHSTRTTGQVVEVFNCAREAIREGVLLELERVDGPDGPRYVVVSEYLRAADASAPEPMCG